MPVLRYFMYVGGALLALLFVIDSMAPKQMAIASNGTEAVERPVVRIRSDQKLPERVVYDTSVPTIVPARTQVAAAEPVAPVSEISAQARVRDTFALFVPQAEPKKVAAAVRHDVKTEPQTAVVPQKLAAQAPKKVKPATNKLNPAPTSGPTHLVQQQPHQPPIQVAQQQPRFGLFGAPMWRTTW